MADQPASAAPRLRLEFMHGLRGLMAFYMVIFHTQTLLPWPQGMGPGSLSLQSASKVFHWGHLAMVLFLVLSGFLLTMPVVRGRRFAGFDAARDGGDTPEARAAAAAKWRGQLRTYYVRRARRILPAFYSACLLLAAFWPAMAWLERAAGFETLHPATQYQIGASYTWGAATTHLLLIHNAFEAYAPNFSPVFWSIATEEHIYLIFPFILVPLWRRFSMCGPLGFAAAVALGLVFLAPNVYYIYPWMLLMFTCGMLCSTMVFSQRPAWRQAYTALPWGWLTVLAIALLVGHLRLQPVDYHSREFPSKMVTDMFTVAAWTPFLIWLARRHPSLAPPETAATAVLAARWDARLSRRLHRAALWVLESRTTLALSAMSYSLYLTHYAPVMACCRLLPPMLASLPPIQRIIVLQVAPVVAAIALGYIVYRICEKPWMAKETAEMFK